MSNFHAHQLLQQTLLDNIQRYRCRSHTIGGGMVVDAGVDSLGGLDAGVVLARLCMGGVAKIEMVPCDAKQYASGFGVIVRTDHPLHDCLGCQYAGWPIQANDYFAMGSGPMRLARGRESVLQHHALSEPADRIVGILESDSLPDADAIELIAAECRVDTEAVNLVVAPSTSLAGSVQVVARSAETSLHKLHELGFDVRRVVSAAGFAPLPPPAKPGDTARGIGRTNDAILYGGTVELWVDCNDSEIEAVLDRVPSLSSPDFGRPFATIFEHYEFDFYKVDPMLFSPAVVTFHNLNSGRSWSHGSIESAVLRHSFLDHPSDS